MTHTLPEEFLLLVLDDERGKRLVEGTRRHAAIAGAALVELTLGGALELVEDDGQDVKRGRFRRTGLAAPSDPLMAEILDEAHDRKPKDAVSRIAGQSFTTNRAKLLEERLLRDFVDRGVLTEHQGWALGIFPTTSWLPGDPAVEAAIRSRLGTALTTAGTPDPRTAALVSLLAATGLITRLFPGEDRKSVKARAKEISQTDWAGSAVKKAVDAVDAAVLAVVVAGAAVGSD